MKYDPVKKSLGRFIRNSSFLRKVFYLSLDLLLLRAWHVRKVLGKTESYLDGEASVLDAGSGFGQYAWRMSRRNKGWKITGIDIDPEHVSDCNSFFSRSGLSERVSFRSADLTELDEDSCYDLILTVDVMEHIRDDNIVFGNFFRSMKPGGIIIISTPSDRGGSDVRCEGDESFVGEHVRNGYGIDEITAKLENSGFRDIRALYTYGTPGNISWKISMKYPVILLNFSRLFFIILPFYYLIILPFAFLLNALDVTLIHKTGTGLIVTARKLTD